MKNRSWNNLKLSIKIKFKLKFLYNLKFKFINGEKWEVYRCWYF